MNHADDDLQACAKALEDRFCQTYRLLTGGIYVGDLLLVDVFYELLRADVIEVGPGLSKDIPL